MLDRLIAWLQSHTSVASILADFEHKAIALEKLAVRKVEDAAAHNAIVDAYKALADEANAEVEKAKAAAAKIRTFLHV